MSNKDDYDLFKDLKQKVLDLDPVYFCENHLTINGEPFRLNGSGYRPFADIYRYIGIKALEPDGLPVILVKGRQVGGTIMACALEMYFMGCGAFGTNGRPPMRVMHAFPHLTGAGAYSKTTLNPMISSSVIDEEDVKAAKNGKVKSFMQKKLDQTSSTTDSLGFKQFINDNHLWVESTGVDADRLRGRTIDCMFFDETQDISGAAITNATKILAKSNYGKSGKGVQVYFGTPKKKGADFYKLWETSTQQYFYLGCENCKKHFPLYTPGSEDWEKIWLHGYIVQCTHCNHQQDKREAAERGKWIGLRDESNSSMIGFHINQLYMPNFTKETIMAEKPGIHPINTERVFQNEVLGEFYHGDSSPITEDEIKEHCADMDRKIRTRINPGEEKIVVVGIDYGAQNDIEQLANINKKNNAGQSFSTAVVLTAQGPGLLHIEDAIKFKRNDPVSKKEIIDAIINNFGPNLVLGDIGFSHDFSSMLHQEYGDRYIVSRAHSKVNDKIKFSKDAFPKELVFERDFYIGEIFEQMKKGMIKFPYKSYERIAWLVSHCASMDIKPSISKYGEHSIHYVKGSTPNDGLMALLNAYLAYKFIITKGFKNNNPLLIENEFKNKNKPLVTTGIIRRRF